MGDFINVLSLRVGYVIDHCLIKVKSAAIMAEHPTLLNEIPPTVYLPFCGACDRNNGVSLGIILIVPSNSSMASPISAILSNPCSRAAMMQVVFVQAFSAQIVLQELAIVHQQRGCPRTACESRGSGSRTR